MFYVFDRKPKCKTQVPLSLIFCSTPRTHIAQRDRLGFFTVSLSPHKKANRASKHGKHRRRHAGATLTEGERYPDDVGLPCPLGHQKHRLPDGALCLQEAQWWLVFLSLFHFFSSGFLLLVLIISNSRVNWVSNFAIPM